ncbi:hypothetical protein [Lysobacter capsici]|uniref:hypothetical protein n=1 Tax=Lysobacter capsici TaxID=435897 RepID=UPI0012FDB721|nr:hypothetical protein [Lysobacter capsici]
MVIDLGNTPLHGACYLIAFLQHTAPDAVATLRALLHADADPKVPFPFGTKTLPDMLQPYPSAMAAYAGLLAEMRSEALEAAWPPAAQPAGRPRL